MPGAGLHLDLVLTRNHSDSHPWLCLVWYPCLGTCVGRARRSPCSWRHIRRQAGSMHSLFTAYLPPACLPLAESDTEPRCHHMCHPGFLHEGSFVSTYCWSRASPPLPCCCLLLMLMFPKAKNLALCANSLICYTFLTCCFGEHCLMYKTAQDSFVYN